MKNKLGCIGVILLILVMLARCSACVQSNLENKVHNDGIYEVEITKVSSEDGDFILKGKTDKNAGFVSYDLASEVIIPLLDDCGVIWKDYGGKVNLFSFNFIFVRYERM